MITADIRRRGDIVTASVSSETAARYGRASVPVDMDSSTVTVNVIQWMLPMVPSLTAHTWGTGHHLEIRLNGFERLEGEHVELVADLVRSFGRFGLATITHTDTYGSAGRCLRLFAEDEKMGAV